MNRIKNKFMRGWQSRAGSFTIEYTALVILIVLALLAMKFYLRGAMCGSFRSVADSFGQGRQYEPGVTTETTSW